MVLKYQEIASDLANKVNNHDYTDKLPSEGELMTEYDASRNTIRNSLDILYNQGLIKRIQGSGYFVNTALHGEDYVMNLANKVGMNSLGVKYPITSKVLKLESIQADDKLAKILECEVGAPVYFIQRLRHSNNKLYALETTYYLKEFIPYLNKEICEKSIFSFIIENYHISIKNADEYVTIHNLTATEAKITERTENSPALRIEEINYLKSERPFNYSKTCYFQDDLTLYYHVSNYLN
ncbi:GntR family transcriptional regulator [Companilactobacillus allii]|uniref:Transcriptional regulator n=1 Tax=Companilactobacillus allii TaxID=1847728 RepID=A0A1P8Q0M8_9LACO|nr:GntR family transcriptional regulator [Companilactobacillus allii]APX71432.1 transcriptional regulator [Companilactobacillus allii]USQ68513.1 GntR family transcriptional regulator [Companilactobacillus allii]